MVFLNTSEEALECFQCLKDMQTASGLVPCSSFPLLDHKLGSAQMHQVGLGEEFDLLEV